MRRILFTVVTLVLVAAVGFGGYRYWSGRRSAIPEFRTAEVTRGELLATIGATGTIEPEEVIDVGAQVAGQILTFGKDAQGKSVDYGSRVHEGDVLLNIDDSTYQADLAQAQAAVAQAQSQIVQGQAGIARSEADYKQMQAKAVQAQHDWERAQKLGPSDALSQVSYDQYKANYDTAEANLGVGQAAIDQAKATLTQAKAQLASAQAGLNRTQRNLGYCVIKSPVNGVIIDRRVNIGQTVVASLNAPSLFLIAKDLTKIQVWVAVNEADIGSIHAGQPVTFTVDALPGKTFKGAVNKVRLNAQMTQNVVTYTVEVNADNSNSELLPYLTASVQFESTRHPDVLMVPNTALRYTPPMQFVSADAQADPAAGGAGGRGQGRQGGGAGQGAGGAQARANWQGPGGAGGAGSAGGVERGGAPSTQRSGEERPNRGTLWVKDEIGKLKPVRVRTGATDGANTEIAGADVKEGMQVITGEQVSDTGAPGGAASPFTPQFGRGGRR